jgi:hypothetical protein
LKGGIASYPLFVYTEIIARFMTPVKLQEFHNSYREVEGYADTAKQTYLRTNQAYDLDIVPTEVAGEIVFKTIVTVYAGKKEDKL